MVCASIIVLRFKAPAHPRPFRTPGIYFGGRLPIVPVIGILANGYLMYSLGIGNWIRLIGWLIVGLFVYFFYSVKHSKVQALPDSTQGM
jgi:APA family basic amino acid/polyamine antiporter